MNSKLLWSMASLRKTNTCSEPQGPLGGSAALAVPGAQATEGKCTG